MPVVVLISGSGTNLQAIIDSADNDLPIEIRAVISNRPNVHGLQRAAQAGIETAVLDHKAFPDRESYDRSLMALIDTYSPALVALAGFMRILTPALVRHYAGRMFNIHPSLLPKYTGLHTHQRVLDAGDALHGASIHFVTEELDGGPLIVQAQVPVMAGDDADTLAARVLEKEHQIYPLAIRWFAENRLRLDENGDVRLDDRKLEQPVVFAPQEAIG
ncbi:MAG: phosphoribosylglycinamide formyltransferase [gamma proteobacterium symbiont of Ctena orbiculata]|uniref:Phosphoribosylglycinamide formyltransferase n=1 Tax=Candidatus Thiodiazotropha taylori TaxID=2792791 RepID=A0A944QT68_9GAMM|nr:phosphoribosylglycinamide formyltransferase [Candidatus Thiodiazotropha taylori]PUB87001.1 MAG: phosphoribosylglycinamide formyltransferase [gamma proteobacterium symbiont of Ctena orbiculata]MBV2135711.1 phosphoribosylglycinamide formyltransferase [Candidatus Thiodiazotropha taylori]PVV09833.1 MAG: phosphoribosylglycinamide formyltransferase [gamma proteobacterium symbiont of Ctena orbiculata]PVV10554.1 MAG: phosphoribosylglycinamide formyltransferase [gamma proteobacterium symbiont of Cten